MSQGDIHYGRGKKPYAGGKNVLQPRFLVHLYLYFVFLLFLLICVCLFLLLLSLSLLTILSFVIMPYSRLLFLLSQCFLFPLYIPFQVSQVPLLSPLNPTYSWPLPWPLKVRWKARPSSSGSYRCALRVNMPLVDILIFTFHITVKKVQSFIFREIFLLLLAYVGFWVKLVEVPTQSIPRLSTLFYLAGGFES